MRKGELLDLVLTNQEGLNMNIGGSLVICDPAWKKQSTKQDNIPELLES